MPLVAALWYGDGRLPLGEFALHARDCSAGVSTFGGHLKQRQSSGRLTDTNGASNIGNDAENSK